MKSIIRLPGMAAFVVIIALFSLVSWLFLDSWIRLAAQSALSQANGAEVNIASASHQFFPLGVSLAGIEITDPDMPEQNRVSVGGIEASIELLPLFSHKVIIDALSVTDITFNQARKQAGWVNKDTLDADSSEQEQTSAQTDIESDSGEGKDIDVDAIIAKAPLKTDDAIKSAQQVYADKQQALKSSYESLPDTAKLKDYETRIKALKEVDYKDLEQLTKAKEELDKIKASLKADKAAIKAFRQQVGDAKTAITDAAKSLRQAPQQDYDLLKGLVSGDAGAIEEATAMVFGDQMGEWSQYVLMAIEQVTPLLNKSNKQAEQKQTRGEGRWISFNLAEPQPDFLIKKADISLQVMDETLTSYWRDITHQHQLLGRPTRYEVDSRNTQHWQQLTLNGQFAVLEQGLKGEQRWKLAGINVKDQNLIDKHTLSSSIRSANIASEGQLQLENAQLHGASKIQLAPLSLSAKGSGKIMQLVAKSLTQLDSLNIQVDISGEAKHPSLAISSDLDNNLKASIKQNFSAEKQKKLDELKAKLNDKINAPLSKLGIDDWQSWDQDANGKESSIDEMLTSQLDNLVDKKKDEVKDKLKDKLKSKLFK